MYSIGEMYSIGSRMNIDPRIPAMPGRSMHVGFSLTKQTLLAPSAKRNVRCSESRMKGELHPTKNRL